MNDYRYGDNTNEDDLNIHIDEESDEIINSHITEYEILKCIKSLIRTARTIKSSTSF